MSNDYEEQELDDKLIQKFAARLEVAINKVLAENPGKDLRSELLTTLMSFASQVAQDIGMDQKNFIDLSGDFYQDTDQEPVEPQKKSKTN